MYILMNNLKSFNEYKELLLEVKSEKDIVKDLARHLSFDKDVVKYLNTSRAKREMGWREFLDTKLHGNNKNYINYLTKNMIADYNPQITGYIHINKDNEGDFDVENEKERDEMDELPVEGELSQRLSNIEQVLGIDPNDDESLEQVEQELEKIGYEKPTIDESEEEPEEE